MNNIYHRLLEFYIISHKTQDRRQWILITGRLAALEKRRAWQDNRPPNTAMVKGSLFE